MRISRYKQMLVPVLSLFTSFSTLICCAIPSLLVVIGMGAVLASFISIFPWLIIISKYKVQVFAVAGLLLIITIYLFWRFKNAPCPFNIKQAKICNRLKIINLKIIIVSSVIYLVGFFFSFLADDIFF
ncbi:MAG: hypothetical protein CBC87_05435 [Rickettsiales bacterium TMED127]|nr:MAG: hypothetical protein CBC87_05435 [Rickettsiales bacterium TMED127]